MTERASFIISNYEGIRQQLEGKNATLIAVSKTYTAEDIKALYDHGHRHFGENKVQELTGKAEQLPADICWHLIGHLQTNKAKYIVGLAHLIHSIDSMKLMQEVQKQAAKRDVVQDVLLQVFIAQEETKFGLDKGEVLEIITNQSAFLNIRICGLMGMATNTDNRQQVKAEFEGLKQFFDELKATAFSDTPHFNTLGMGMTGDYDLALEAGSNMIRVGSAIFGRRE